MDYLLTPDNLLVPTNSNLDSADKNKWIQWTYFFAATDGIALSVYSKVKTEVARKALKALHLSLKAVSDEFIVVINSPEIPDVPVPPVPVIDWDDDPSLLSGIMEIIQASISVFIQIISKHITPQLQPLLHAFAALLREVRSIIDVFKSNGL